MIYLAFSGAKSNGWLDNEHAGFWPRFLFSKAKSFADASFALFLDHKVES
jgi:hypothetical protein